MILYSEVGGQCPICITNLTYEKGGKIQKVLKGAHIYPLNPTTDEVVLIADEEMLSKDVNHLHNLIG